MRQRKGASKDALATAPSTGKKHTVATNKVVVKEQTKVTPYSNSVWLLVFLILFRVINAFYVQTYFNPDEYWQSLEVAYQFVFGKGELTWEWRSDARIRGSLHPLIFAGMYKLLAICGLDSRFLVAQAGHTLQGVFAGIGDYFLYRFAYRYSGPGVARWTLFIALTDWFSLYCMVRTFSNSLETILCTVAYAYWPWAGGVHHPKQNMTHIVKSLSAAALACAVRPTSAVLWIFLTIQYLYRVYKTPSSTSTQLQLRQFLIASLVIAFVWLVSTVSLDTWFYGLFTFVPYEFLKFNVLTGGSALYGTHPWHWYLSEAISAMNGVYIVFMVSGIYTAWRLPHGRELLTAMIACITFFSLNAHKEYRFILPVLPLCFVYAGQAMRQMETYLLPRDRNRIATKTLTHILIIILLLMINFGALTYLGVFHQRAPISVMSYLSTRPAPVHVEMLCGCHSTPGYSQLHTTPSATISALDCSPQTWNDSLSMKYTETTVYEQFPLAFAMQRYEWPKRERFVQTCMVFSEDECVAQAGNCAWFKCSNSPDACGYVGSNMDTMCPVHEGNVQAVVTWRIDTVLRDRTLAIPANSSSVALYKPFVASTFSWSEDTQVQQVTWCMKQQRWTGCDDAVNMVPTLGRKPLLPTYLVIYSDMYPKLLPFLRRAEYSLVQALWHSHLGDTPYFLVFYRA